MPAAQSELRDLVDALPTKSAKIRALNEQGMERADIARFLGLRYQHVRNVLVADEAKRKAGPPAPVSAKLDPAGRVLIPSQFRDHLGLAPGDKLVLRLNEDGIQVTTLAKSVEAARSLVRQYVPAGEQLSDSLIETRRAEASEL